MKTRRQFGLLAVSALAAPRIAIGETKCWAPSNGVRACVSGVRDVPMVSQRCPQWCWAACAELLFALQGYKVPQEQFVQKVYGIGPNCSPAVGKVIATAITGTWYDTDRKRLFAIASPIMDLSLSPGARHPAPMDVVRTELDSGRAVIAGTLGHAIAITALEYYENSLGQGKLENVIVRDPFPYEAMGQKPPYFERRGPNKFVMTPQQFFNGHLLMTVQFA